MDIAKLRVRYGEAILPPNTTWLIDRKLFRALKKWQEDHPITDGERVLTIDKLPTQNVDAHHVIQELAYECAMKHGEFALLAFEALRPTFFETAEAFVTHDTNRQILHYIVHKKRRYHTNPPVTAFPSKEIHAAAIAGRHFLCDLPDHDDNARMLTPDQTYSKGQKRCILCTRKQQMQQRSRQQ
tara:strand:+ start:197 stop:748 length:552 start_codon:yes stop_codon:yes gene_type:complete